jgi:SAM-dependent methyltransferase
MFYTVQTLQSEIRSLVRHLSLPDGEWEAGIRAQPSTTPSVDILEKSTVCRQEHFDKPDFAYWIQKLNAGRTYHRKNWEHVYICKALFERNMLRPGMRGLGFAVGRERLPAFFASMGCEIVATDLAADDDRATHWRNAQQYSTAKANLAFPDLVSSAEFERLVSFEAADMNAIPDQLRDFDFCWSACAFEHLGSIEAGLKFVEASIECLKPGGYAVHTTEFNLSSDTDTVDNNHTVLFRRRDMEVLAKRLVARGYRVAPLDFSPGSQPLDRYIYMPPYRQNPHLRLMLMGYVSTSFGMIIQR